MGLCRLLLIVWFVGLRFHAAAQTGPGYLILKEEKKLGVASTDNSSRILDAVVAECKKDLRAKDLSPRKVLGIIGNNVFELGFTFEENHATYTDALASRKFDCDQFVITYLTVCRSLNLPGYGVPMPQHMAVGWEVDGSMLLWETTINAEKDRTDYIRDFHISKEGIANGVWLNTISAKDESGIVNNYVGEMLFHAKRYSEAKPYFQKALSELPRLSPSQNNLGLVLKHEGKPDESRRLLKELVKTDPFDYRALNNIGLLFFDNKQYDSALHYYERSIEIEDKFPSSLYNRGLVLGQGYKKYDDAIQSFDAALALNTISSVEASDCYMNRGVCFIYKKDYKEAVRSLSEAIRFDSTNSNALVNRAIAKYSLGENDDACTDIRQAIKVGNKAAAGYEKKICK